MLAQSALPNKRPSHVRDLAALRKLSIMPRLGDGPCAPQLLDHAHAGAGGRS
jgi:hypothetical protein